MWLFLVAIGFVILIVLVLLIFYVTPELIPVVFGPTGPCGPVNYEQLETTAQFLDGLASVVSDVPVSMVRIGEAVTVTIPGFSFTDAAFPRSGQILAVGVIPSAFRPDSTVNEMCSTFSNVRKIGMAQISNSGDISIFVNALVDNLVLGDAWIAGTNNAGNVSFSYTTL